MNVSRSVLKLFLSRSGNSLLFFAGITLFARWLNPNEIGLFFLFLALGGILSIPANVGIRGALEKRLSEGSDPERMLGSALVFKLVTASIVSAILLAGRGYIDTYAGTRITVLLVVYLIIKEFSLFYISVIRGELRVGETAPVQFARRLVWIAVGAALVTLGWGARGLIAGLICGRAVEFLWAFKKVETGSELPAVDAVRSLVAFSKYDTVLSVGGRIYQWMDVIVIAFFLTQAHVGAYEMAWRVSLMVLLVSKSLELTLFPQISRWDAESSVDRIGSAVSTALQYTLFVSVPALVGSVLYAEEILRYLFGPEYAFASVVLVILMVEKVFQSVNDIIGSTIRAVDRVDLAAYVAVLSVGANLLLSPLLAVTVGFAGVAVATTLSWLLNTVLHMHYLKQLVSFKIPYRLLAWYAFASAIMGGSLLALARVVPVTGLLTLLLHVSVGVITYTAAVAGMPRIRNEVLIPGVRRISS